MTSQNDVALAGTLQFSYNTTLKVPEQFPTVNEALKYIEKRRIPGDVEVTIELQRGYFNLLDDSISMSNVRGNINIIGQPVVTQEIIAVLSCEQTNGGFFCDIMVSSTEDILVNDYVTIYPYSNYISNVSNLNKTQFHLFGCHRVTKVEAEGKKAILTVYIELDVTLRQTYNLEDLRPPFDFPMILSAYKTVVLCKKHGIVCNSSRLNFLNDIVLLGDWKKSGVGVGLFLGEQVGNCSAVLGNHVAIKGFYIGAFVSKYSQLYSKGLFVSGNREAGLKIENGVVNINNLYNSDNGIGISQKKNASVTVFNSLLKLNTHAFSASTHSDLEIPNAVIVDNYHPGESLFYSKVIIAGKYAANNTMPFSPLVNTLSICGSTIME